MRLMPRTHRRVSPAAPRLALSALLLLIGAAAARGESAYLVRDLAPGTDESARVAPVSLFAHGDRAFFYGNDLPMPGESSITTGFWVSDGTASGTQPLANASFCAGRGCPPIVGAPGQLVYFFGDEGGGTLNLFWALWRSDGTRAGTFRLHEAGPVFDGQDGFYTFPQYAFLGDVVYFRGCPESLCDQLWRTDGTPTGTTLVADLTPPPAVQTDNDLDSLTSFGGKLYFLSPLPSDGQAVLWRSDGTSAGTSPFKVFDGASPSQLTVAGSHLFFIANARITGGVQLWVTDGASDPGPVLPFAAIGWMKPVGDRVYFVASDGTHGPQLWVSDATAAGTTALTGFTDPKALYDLRYDTRLMEALGNRLLLFASDGAHPATLWSITGASQPPANLCPAGCGTELISTALVKVGARVAFLTGTASGGYALWGSDGTAAGTQLLRKTCDHACSLEPRLQLVGGKVFFPVEDGSGSLVLWQSDGTAAGTLPYAGGVATAPATRNSEALGVAPLGGKLLLAAADSGGGIELWASDGTAAGTRQLTDVNAPKSSGPFGFVSLGNLVFFAANTTPGNLWQSAGTAATTMPVPGVNAYASSTYSTGPLVAAGRSVFFQLGDQLWRADGSANGTLQLTSLPSSQPFGSRLGPKMVALQDQLFFLVLTQSAASMWKSDGTPGGTVSAFQLPSSANNLHPESLSAAGGLLFYTASDLGGVGYGLWRSDGTAAGTFALARTLDPQPTAAGNSIYFSATRDGNKSELWRTDGTVAGTAPVMAGSQVAGGPNLTLLAGAGDILYFVVHGDSFPDSTLWRTDGTPGGTFPLVKFYEGSGIPFAVLDNQLFIALDDLVHGSGLWASDGSVAGTRLLRAFQPATAYTPLSLYALAPAGGRVFFSADDGVHGFELWESDGTAAGTRLVQDILPGPAGSNPGGRAQAGDLLFFAADDGLTGAELWALPLTGSTLCRPAPTALCLADDRFKVEAYWRDFQGNSGAGQAVALTPDTGYFWFFSPDAVEVIGKLIDGRPLNGNFWFFYGALSNVEYSLTVTDTASGAARRYLNPSGQLASVGDTAAFGPQGAFGVTDPANGPAGAAPAAAPATGDHAATQGATPAGAPAARRRAMVTLSGQTTSGARTGSTGAGAATWHASGEAGRAGQGATSEDGACSPGAATLCLGGQRFAATVSWQDFSGRTGAGTAVDLTPDTGYFWFFSPDAVELVLKVLDGRAVNGKFWVFYGALSNVAYTITIRDTATGNIRTYTNPAGQFASVADTGAF